jgi:hypothetical protein
MVGYGGGDDGGSGDGLEPEVEVGVRRSQRDEAVR